MTLLLDTAALIALEQNERAMWVRLKAAVEGANVPVTHAGVLGQAWRGGPRQARLSQALGGLDIRAVDRVLGRAAGELLGRTSLSDVIDAALALLAEDDDEIVTADRNDFQVLASVLGRHVELIRP